MRVICSTDAHGFDFYGDGAFAAEGRGERGHALLGESVRWVAATAATGFEITFIL